MEKGRIPPFNQNAEKAVLGAFLQNKQLNENLHRLTSNDFYLLAHQKIFEAIEELYMKSNIDVVVVGDYLDKTEQLENIGGYGYLAELSDTPMTSNCAQHTDIVLYNSKLRQIIDLCGTATVEAFNESDPASVSETLEQGLYEMSNECTTKPMTYRQVAELALKGIEKTYAGEISVIKTHFPALDKIIDGFSGGEFNIIAARPAMGKSAFMLNLAMNVSKYEGKKVGIFSKEMPNVQIMKRSLAAQTLVNIKNIKNGTLTDEEWDKIGNYDDYNILFYDHATMNWQEIKSICRQHKLEIIFVDYLQLFEGKGENRNQEVSKLTRQGKLTAMDLDIPIIMLSQLSRNCEQRSNKRPILADLRDSGSIEQDASIVMAIYRPDVYIDDEQPTNDAEIIVLKSRESATGTAHMKWDGTTQRFYEEEKREMKETKERMPFDGI